MLRRHFIVVYRDVYIFLGTICYQCGFLSKQLYRSALPMPALDISFPRRQTEKITLPFKVLFFYTDGIFARADVERHPVVLEHVIVQPFVANIDFGRAGRR